MINEDWALDVKKYVPDADDGIIAGIVRYCGIALRKVDSSLVAFSDPKETARVRDGYCRKKLGLTDSDADVDAAIAAVGERMKDDRTKNRVTVYYLLAEHFGKLDIFAPKAKAGAATAGAGAAVAATAVGAAALTSGAAEDVAAQPAAMAPAEPAPQNPAPATPVDTANTTTAGLMSAGVTGAAATGAAATGTDATGATGMGAAGVGAAATGAAAAGLAAASTAAPSLAKQDDHDHAGASWTQPVATEPSGGFMFGAVLGVIGLIIAAALLAWFISSRMGASPDEAAPVVAAAPAPAAPAAPAPAAPPTPPEGSGVIATEVAGRPMVSVYFDSGSALIASDFAAVAAPIKAWLDANPGDMAQVSGFNDPTGNAEFNADLSRRRAEGVAAALRDLGVADNQIDLEPPASATDASTDLAGARRVEITVVPLN